MRTQLKTLVLCLVPVLLPAAFSYAQCQSRCCEEEFPRLTVQGESRKEVLADKAYFNIRLRQEEKRLDRAFDESAKKINSISATLTSFGVKKEDIRNMGYVYHPLYEGKMLFSSVTRPTSYEIIYSLRVTIYDLGQLGKILAGLSDVPETTVFGLTYTSTKIEELKREALKEAAADARQKALKLAEGSGAALGKLMKIETNAQERFLMNRMAEERAVDTLAMAKAEMAPVPQVESGYIEILGSCSATYSVQ
ncbi:MAG: SIMPL domain-containing protein [Deltaproteobacteria bacterium]